MAVHPLTAPPGRRPRRPTRSASPAARHPARLLAAGPRPHLRVGIDTGGTFTDLVVIGLEGIAFLKVPSTPADPARSVLEGLDQLGANRRGAWIAHGSTVATNALIERKGGPAALVTTAGFEDLIEIERQARPALYDWNVLVPGALIPRSLRFGIAERTFPAARRSPLTRERLRELARLGRHLVRLGVGSAAVCFLHSYRDGRNETAAARVLSRFGLSVTASHRLVGEYREYERFSTACANAYLQPIVGKYLGVLVGRVRGRLRVLKSSGLTSPARAVAGEPVHTVLSGPAGGVLASHALCRELGIERAIAFDMGGTSTDASLIAGGMPFSSESRLAGVTIHVPAVAVESVGAGGGSIARVDEGGALRVGPESSGADPGPACYGRGMEATVTDANLVLGRLRSDELLGGGMQVDAGRARRALARIGRLLSASPERCAEGIIEVANTNMERVLRAVSLQRGNDPRLFTLVSYGGAAGLHACALADAIGVRRIVIPPSPGTFSALGVALALAGRDESRTVLMGAFEDGAQRLEGLFRNLEARASAALSREGLDPRTLVFERTADLRYRGQSHELTVPGRGNVLRAFHEAYRLRYGEGREGSEAEVVTLRLRAREREIAGLPGSTGKAGLSRLPGTAGLSGGTAGRGSRQVFSSPVVIAGKLMKVPAYRRESLAPGARLRGPARLLEYSSTTLLMPGWMARVDGAGNLDLRSSRAGGRLGP